MEKLTKQEKVVQFKIHLVDKLIREKNNVSKKIFTCAKENIYQSIHVMLLDQKKKTVI